MLHFHYAVQLQGDRIELSLLAHDIANQIMNATSKQTAKKHAELISRR